MSENSDTSASKKRYRGRLRRKAFLIIVPIFSLPVIAAVIGGQFLPGLYPNNQILAILGILIVSGFIISALFIGFLTRQVINPLQKIRDIIAAISLGDFTQLADDRRKDEIGHLAYAVNQIGDNLRDRYTSLENQLQARNEFIHTAAQIGETTTSIVDIDEILGRTVTLITENFFHFHAAIFIIDTRRAKASLRAIHGRASTNPECQDYTLPVDGESIIGWSAKYNQTRIAIDVQRDPLYQPFPGLPDTRSQIAIPISIPGMVLGVLDIQDGSYDAFGEEEIVTLQLVANQLAAAIHIRFPLGIGSVDPATTETLYRGTHAITIAQTVGEVFQQLGATLRQMPYAAALYNVEENLFHNQLLTDSAGKLQQDETLEILPITPANLNEFIPKSLPILLSDPRQLEAFSKPVIELCQRLDYKFPTLYPISAQQKLVGLLFVGATRQETLSLQELEVIGKLVEIANTSIEKVFALQTISDHAVELQTLKAVSQSISTETNLTNLYRVIHQQIVQVMGQVNFLIALYNKDESTIEIPYMEEDEQISRVPPFPLGEGLTSIIIRTRQPLLLVEDTVNRSRALGAIITGDRPALSWLGVPMILGGEILGAIIVQDLKTEHRFDEDDMHLLTTLAAQVAIAINNTRLVETTQARARRDRQLLEITEKIRFASDVQGVITRTTQELVKALNLRRAKISLSVEQHSPTNHGGEHKQEAE